MKKVGLSLEVAGVKLSSPQVQNKANVVHKPKTQPIKTKTTNLVSSSKKPATIPKKVPDKAKKIQEKNLQKSEPKIEEVPQKQQNVSVETVPLESNELKQQKQEIIIPQPLKFEVMLRYNHYKQKFQCVDNVLSFQVPNEKYCFGLVFKGNYQPVVRKFKSRQIVEPLTRGKANEFSWKVQENMEYEVQIEEDEEQQSKYEKKVYKAPQTNSCPIKRNKAAQDLTEQMKNLRIDELGTDKHREMLEQRDLQDILFS